MDSNLKNLINFAKKDLTEIEQLSEEGKLTDKGVFVRIFTLGQVLVGWDDDLPRIEAVNNLIHLTDTVEAMLDEARKARAS